MTTTDRLVILDNLHAEFMDAKTTDRRRVEIALEVQSYAAEEMPESKCLDCGKNGIYLPYGYALIQGHCYSHDGMIEYTSISRFCEYCFDKMCAAGDPDDESIPAVGPRD